MRVGRSNSGFRGVFIELTGDRPGENSDTAQAYRFACSFFQSSRLGSEFSLVAFHTGICSRNAGPNAGVGAF